MHSSSIAVEWSWSLINRPYRKTQNIIISSAEKGADLCCYSVSSICGFLCNKYFTQLQFLWSIVKWFHNSQWSHWINPLLVDEWYGTEKPRALSENSSTRTRNLPQLSIDTWSVFVIVLLLRSELNKNGRSSSPIKSHLTFQSRSIAAGWQTLAFLGDQVYIVVEVLVGKTI